MTKWSCVFKLEWKIKSLRLWKCRLEIMPDKVLRHSGSFCSTVSFAILHLGFFFARLSRGIGWTQNCDVMVFEKFCFHRPHENAKTEFSKISNLDSVFGHRFHQIRMDGSPIRKEKVAFSNESRYVCTWPTRYIPPCPCLESHRFVKT